MTKPLGWLLMSIDIPGEGKYYTYTFGFGGIQDTYNDRSDTYSVNKDWLINVLHNSRQLASDWEQKLFRDVVSPMTCSEYKAKKGIGTVPTKAQVLQAYTDFYAGIIDKACVVSIDDDYMNTGVDLISCYDFRLSNGIGTTATVEQVQIAQASHAAGIIDDACLLEIQNLPRTPSGDNSSIMIGVGAGVAVLGLGYLLTRKRRQ